MKGITLGHLPGRPKPHILTVTIDGKRTRTGYATKAEAEKAKAKAEAGLIKHGREGAQFDSAAFREWDEARRVLGDSSVSLVEVALFWREHGKRDCPKIPMEQAFDDFLADKKNQGLSARHLRDLRLRVGRFARDFSGYSVEQASPELVLDWLKQCGGAPRTVRNNHLAVSNFLNYAERRGWTDKAPAIHESDMPRVKASAKGVLSVKETAKLFAYLQKHRPKYLAWFALQAFAGIRRAEADRMRWEYVDFKRKRIVIPASVCKTGDDWVMLDLPKNLWAWLDVVRHLPVHAPANKSRDLIIKAVGLDWPQNALRHSFCTYHLSMNGSAEKTALLLRHRNTAQLWRSYFAGLKSKAESARYFAVAP